MAMVDICMQEVGKPAPVADVAGRQALDARYLEQIFNKLRKAQLVQSVRGPGGGYLLARPQDGIAIADIITAVNEKTKMTRCIGQKGCMPNGAKCLVHDLWEALDNNISTFLQSVSLADVVNGNHPSVFCKKVG